jgi:hypothetical protein
MGWITLEQECEIVARTSPQRSVSRTLLLAGKWARWIIGQVMEMADGVG